MRKWTDYPELADANTFRRILSEEGSFERVAKRLSCNRMSVRHAAAAHGVESPYRVKPKFIREK